MGDGTYEFRHRSDIQGLRGLAVLLVVLYHVGLPVSGGFIGVDVFFVISGFVITGGILKALHSENGFSFRDFYARRIRRLLPALSLVLAVCVILGIGFGPETSQKLSGRTAVAAALLNANHYLYRSGGYFEPAAESNVFLHTWSLSVEEQFYLFFPFLIVLLWFVARKLGKPKVQTVALGICFLILFSILLEFVLTYTSFDRLNGPRLAFYFAGARAWEFGLGGVLACFVPLFARWKRQMDWFGWAGLALVLVPAFHFTNQTVFPGYAALFPAVGAALLILPGISGSTTFTRFLSWRPLVRAGDLSYSWYLWHWPIVVFVRASWPGETSMPIVIFGLGSIGLAWLTEKFVETPIRYRPPSLQRPAWQILTVCLVVPVLAWLIQVNSSPSVGRIFPVLSDLRSMGQKYKAIGCDSSIPYSAESACQWGPKDGWTAILIGDSNARQHIPVLKEVVLEAGGQLHATSYSRCGFILDMTPIDHTSPFEDCPRWIEASLNNILKKQPKIVFIGSAVDEYSTFDRWSFRYGSTEYKGEAEKLALIQKQNRKLVEVLKRNQIHVVLIDPPPKFTTASSFGANCSLFRLTFAFEECAPSNTLGGEDLRIHRNGMNANKLGAEAGALQVNLAEPLCQNGECRSYVNGWVYRDRGHLSYEGSLTNYSVFREAVEGLLH